MFHGFCSKYKKKTPLKMKQRKRFSLGVSFVSRRASMARTCADLFFSSLALQCNSIFGDNSSCCGSSKFACDFLWSSETAALLAANPTSC